MLKYIQSVKKKRKKKKYSLINVIFLENKQKLDHKMLKKLICAKKRILNEMLKIWQKSKK
jgi:hypothetical protein